jgi:Uma2 family endonuclease
MGQMTATEAPRTSFEEHQEVIEINIAKLNGLWTEEQYLVISELTNRLIEFVDGTIEILPMPTEQHQTILALLYELFVAIVRPRSGKVLFAAFPMRLRSGKYREPDLLVLLDINDSRRRNEQWLGADVVVEIVSPDNPKRDIVTKRTEYAEAGIPEYWIVNPQDETITVLELQNDAYIEHGVFRRGDRADSKLIPGLNVGVDDVFDVR